MCVSFRGGGGSGPGAMKMMLNKYVNEAKLSLRKEELEVEVGGD